MLVDIGVVCKFKQLSRTAWLLEVTVGKIITNDPGIIEFHL